MTKAPAALAVVFIVMTLAGECLAGSPALRVGFYNGKCGRNDVEAIVFDIVKGHYIRDRTLPAALLRMLFHDCFVRGCDASLLLDVPGSEKTAIPNGSVRSYEVIDAVKSTLEHYCPGLVSCADIVNIATRAAVVMGGGRWYNVETGRRDGIVSKAADTKSLPPPNVSVAASIQAFAAKGLGKEDFVLLLGGHTVGITHCALIQNRLYSFNNVPGKTDPSINPTFLPFLKRTCPRNGNGGTPLFLDQSSPKSVNTVDNGLYKAIIARKGVLEIDQKIALDPSTKYIVAKYASNNPLFQFNFGKALVRLGRMGVLTGNQGQVRKSCRRVNPVKKSQTPAKTTQTPVIIDHLF